MMLPKELRQVLKLSGGKMILSQGDVQNSYVVMKLSEYLKEKRKREDDCCFDDDDDDDYDEYEEEYDEEEVFGDSEEEKKEDEDGQGRLDGNNLTNEELLDRINADIGQLRQRKTEQELQQQFEVEDGESEREKDYRYESVQR